MSNQKKTLNERVTKGDSGSIVEIENTDASYTQPSDIPPKKFKNIDLKKMKGFKGLRKLAKSEHMKKQFLSDIEQLTPYFPADINQLNDELLKKVFELAEDHFFYGSKESRDELKLDTVIEVMLPYYKNDLKMLENNMRLVIGGVKKLSFRRRMGKRFYVFFVQSIKAILH
jgi:hypothetical protein